MIQVNPDKAAETVDAASTVRAKQPRRTPGRLALLLVMASLISMRADGQASALNTSDWRSRLASELPLLGHRNWILVVDSAYPLQTSPGVETIETNDAQEEVVRTVLESVSHSIHVRPVIYMDAELPDVPEADAPGVTAYRTHMAAILRGLPMSALAHEQILSKIDEAGKGFHVLVLKTTMTIPYTSVFMQLDCKYWSADAEARLRARQAAASKQ